jgi:hypothetical protein
MAFHRATIRGLEGANRLRGDGFGRAIGSGMELSSDGNRMEREACVWPAQRLNDHRW